MGLSPLSEIYDLILDLYDLFRLPIAAIDFLGDRFASFILYISLN